MRIGKAFRSTRQWKKADSMLEMGQTPLHISSETVIGRLNSDIIASVYAPYITKVAEESLEQYAHESLVYQELMRDVQASKKNGSAEIDPDGVVRIDNGVPLEPRKPLFSSRFNIDEAETLLKETSEYFSAKNGGYRVHLKAAKFERMLDEKYGRLRPFITAHPELEQFLRSVQRKYATGYFSPFRQGDPPIPRSTAVIILFMMQRGKVRWEVMVLGGLFFLIGLQPWALVLVVAIAQGLMSRRKSKAIRGMPSEIPAVDSYYDSEETKKSKWKSPVGNPLKAGEDIDTSLYDVMVLGSGPSALYSAALLSRAGRRVLVLSGREDASGCVTMENKFQSIPFDIEASNVGRLSHVQNILAPALATASDTQGGVRFCKIGSELDGHAFEILSIFGMGADSADLEIPFVLRADGGIDSVMDDAAVYLGDGWPDADGGTGNSATGTFIRSCEAINAAANRFYMSKILPEKWESYGGGGQYQESSIRYAQSFFDQSFPLNAHARSLMAGIGLKGENIRPKAASLAPYVTNISSAMSGEGMHYPVGGPRALGHALVNVIERSGGRVLSGVQVSELRFGKLPEPVEEQNSEASKEGGPCPTCRGVKLSDGRRVCFDEARFADNGIKPAVISMEGFLATFIGMLPDDIRVKYKVPRGLPALTSRRPVFKILFCLSGSAESLEVTGADYYRLPNAAVAQDEIDQSTGSVKHGEIGWPEHQASGSQDPLMETIEVDAINNDSQEDPKEGDSSVSRRSKCGGKVQYNTRFSWMQISFPSAKDPEFESCYGEMTTCVVTVEADDDFVTFYDAQPKLYGMKKEVTSNVNNLLEKVKKDLFNVYPQLEGKVVHCEAAGPFRRGLSHNPERFAAKGIHATTPYPGLFMGGDDLTVGESFSAGIVGGWLVANAVMEYSPVDHLFLQKNITSDIQQFLQPPFLDEEDEEE